MKRIYVLAGANGSGKSTIAKVLLPMEGIVYVNPDDIASEFNPHDPVSARVAAGRETLRRIDSLISHGTSFAIETTLSGSAYVKLFRRAREHGYEILISYVFVDSVDVCIERIASRVKRGGHFVPDEDVRRRYRRSRCNFVNVYASLASRWMLYYNGGTDVSLVAHGNGEINIISSERYDAFKEEVCQTLLKR